MLGIAARLDNHGSGFNLVCVHHRQHDFAVGHFFNQCSNIDRNSRTAPHWIEISDSAV